MSTILERYHAWRKGTFPASKEDVAWRHSFITAKLDSIAIALQSLNEIVREPRPVESSDAASRAACRLDAQKLDEVANDLQALKQKQNAFCSKSAVQMTLEILNAIRGGKVKFLQIGGNDGVLADPIYKFIKAYDWEGVIVEPIPEYFEKLRQAYADRPRVRYVNAAIDTQAGSRTIYKVKADVVRSQILKGGDGWLQGIASFSKDWLVLGNDLSENDIEAVSVETIKGADVVRDHGIDDCDVMIVDVEGAEGVVFSSFDFNAWRPRVIIFESDGKSPDEKAAIEAQLVPHGYVITWEHYDSVAVLTGDRLTRF
jgi:FkbM family methyltransferase